MVIFHGDVSHNQRVFQIYFRNTSCWMIIWYYLPKCCGAKPKRKTNDWGVGRGPCGMVLNPWHGFLAVPCSLSPWCLDFHFHDVWPLLFYPLLNIIFHFLSIILHPAHLFFSQWFDASRPGPKNHEHFGRRARCTSVLFGFFFRKFPWFI